MDKDKQALQGSPLRDKFKRAHKQLSGRFYATDLDFILVEKEPPGIVACFDYKHPMDRITFAEVLAYNALNCPVYIIQASDPEHGPFRVQR